MRIVFLTTDDPIYLPAFFERVLGHWAAETLAVYVVPPLYRNQSRRAAAWRYYRTFGMGATVALARRIFEARLRRQSISSSCERYGVPCAMAADVNTREFIGELAALRPDLVVSVSCPQIFKRQLIEIPPKGCLNVHGAVLPNYRGVMPSFWMLANGETTAGVTVHFVDERVDAGEVCGQAFFEIAPDESLDRFLQRSKQVAAELLMDVLARIESGTVERSPVDLTQGSYYSWPDRDAVKRFAAGGRRLW
jgi:folate-dependent phosphoribosylglycinamide formyltransferase PurN